MVAAAMRDEGAFIVEWVCWYRLAGFDAILVATNDCADRSPDLLNALHDAGWLTHITHSPDAGTPAKRSAHRAIAAHPLVARAGWLMICDVDEFWVPHRDRGTIGGFIGHQPKPYRAMAFHWKVFGDSGLRRWSDTLVHRAFTRAAPTPHPANTSFKTLVRDPAEFDRFGAHSPSGFNGTWGEGSNHLVDSQGRRLGSYDPNRRTKRATAPDRVTHERAQMNHYMIRWQESFALKRGIRSASAHRDRYTDAFHAKFNRNEETDISALRRAAEFDAVHAAAMALPGVARLHHLCCADYVRRLVAPAGTQAEADPRWIRHMDMASSMT